MQSQQAFPQAERQRCIQLLAHLLISQTAATAPPTTERMALLVAE